MNLSVIGGIMSRVCTRYCPKGPVRAVIEYMTRPPPVEGVRLLPWPERSPDLLPIENVWLWVIERASTGTTLLPRRFMECKTDLKQLRILVIPNPSVTSCLTGTSPWKRAVMHANKQKSSKWKNYDREAIRDNSEAVNAYMEKIISDMGSSSAGGFLGELN
ncbi:hypothetical protein TNCV_1620811 [Trichonephila clavipes]|nr:hypothetical protein TNCV_1620811 [Trichonephila clavipes]